MAEASPALPTAALGRALRVTPTPPSPPASIPPFTGQAPLEAPLRGERVLESGWPQERKQTPREEEGSPDQCPQVAPSTNTGNSPPGRGPCSPNALICPHAIPCQDHMTTLRAQGCEGRPGAGRGAVLAEPEDASGGVGAATGRGTEWAQVPLSQKHPPQRRCCQASSGTGMEARWQK